MSQTFNSSPNLYDRAVSTIEDLRRALHARPELAHEETATAASLARALGDHSPDQVITGVGETGLIATFEGASDGPTLLFRAELDALPIRENEGCAHRSSVEGRSHACGHDGHMAILVGLAERLDRRRPATGRVHLLFQPAEETGTGARAVLDDPAFGSVRPDLGFALHNLPGHAVGTVVVKAGSLTPAVRSLVLRFAGRTAHASEPHLGQDPTAAIAELVLALRERVQADPAEPGYRLITPVHVRTGSIAYGVTPGDGEVHLTVRTIDQTALDELTDEIVALAGDLAEPLGVRFDHAVVEDFHANDNHPEPTGHLVGVAADLGLEVFEPPVLGMPAGEDFGLFGERFPCCMALLGAGVDHPPLHSPDYDFPDELLAIGVDLLDGVVRRILDRQR